MTLSEAGRLAMVDEDRRKQILAEAVKQPHEPVKRIMRSVLTANRNQTTALFSKHKCQH